MEPEEIIILGGIGTRMDHTFTTILSLNTAVDTNIDCCICDEHNKIYVKNKSFRIEKDLQYGDYVSFVPLSSEVTLSLNGMKYDLDRQVVKQGVTLLQSNEIQADVAEISIYNGSIIVFETRD